MLEDMWQSSDEDDDNVISPFLSILPFFIDYMIDAQTVFSLLPSLSPFI